MKIGIDFDGVVTNVGTHKAIGAKTLFGRTIPPEKFRREILFSEKILTEAEYRQLQKAIYESEELGFLMEPVPGLAQYLNKLLSEGHEVSIVTARLGISAGIARQWMKRNDLPLLPLTEVGWKKSKAPYVQGFDVFVDDDFEKLEPLTRIVPRLFLFSWGYNRKDDTSGIATRVTSWKELYWHINNLS